MIVEMTLSFFWQLESYGSLQDGNKNIIVTW
jgi:hypothetical protein